MIAGMRAAFAAGRTAVVIECHGNAAAIVARLEEQSGYDVSVLGSTWLPQPLRRPPISSPSRQRRG